LDPKQGRRYIEPTKGDEIGNLYNMTMRMENYVNPTTNDELNWRSINSCTSYSKEVLENS
jgi:hypothetical protein